ncbi:RimJ/RimL family protein N-acetyltransferase [Bradyrhizobium sp. AZCC 2262]
MIPPLKKGATLPQPDWPGIETERLILRQWRASDVTANTMMLGDPLSARFITADRKPVTEPMVGWRNAAIMAGHWVLHGFGMFVVEEKASGTFVGRVGPFYPPVWPGFEVGWGVWQRNSGARAMPSKRRGPRSTGRLRRSNWRGSSTASIARTRPLKP